MSPDSPDLRRPVDRLYGALGANFNARHFTLLEGSINAIKGRIEVFNAPMGQTPLRNHVRDAVDANFEDPNAAIESFLAPLRETRGVFQYLNAADVVERLDASSAAVLQQLQLIELHNPDAHG